MFEISFTPSALDDVAWFRKHEQAQILDSIEAQLSHEPTIETRNRKRLRPNQVSEWELRIGKFRVFYDVVAEDNLVEIRLIGSKTGNILHVQGKEYPL